LIVEDEYMLADDLRQEIEDAGAVVLGPAPDAQSALELVGGETRIDGAVLDINLGGEVSYPIADALAARRIPFLFTTGYDASALPGRYAHVTRCEKPLRVSAVRDAIGRELHG
jgi:DNA-binding LytR/AlgR family response regulator